MSDMSYLVKWQVHGYWDWVSVCCGYKLVSILRQDYSPSLHSGDEMEKKIVSRFPVLEVGSLCWKLLGQVTKSGGIVPRVSPEKGFRPVLVFCIRVWEEDDQKR